MDLTVSVGVLASVLLGPENRVYLEQLRDDFRDVNQLLRKNDFPEHNEPEELPDIPLRRFAEKNPRDLLRALRQIATADLHPHLIHHSDADGYYVPIDFPHPLKNRWRTKVPGGFLGSSQRLVSELQSLAPVLNIPLVDGTLSDETAAILEAESGPDARVTIPHAGERKIWFTLFECASASVENGTAIAFR